MGKKMSVVKKCDVPVVEDDYLDKAVRSSSPQDPWLQH